jgi:hypothetical protein
MARREVDETIQSTSNIAELPALRPSHKPTSGIE